MRDGTPRRRAALNEGRPFRAGNPVGEHVGRALARFLRSTKAGPSGPATPVLVVGPARSVITRAQRRPALPGRQPPIARSCSTIRPDPRSTKAGPSGPATPWRCWNVPAVVGSLNEGRPFRAGNPCGVIWRGEGLERRAAQRRPALPGRQPPRRTMRIGDMIDAQRRPALPGRQPRSYARGLRTRRERSTKAGPSGPATPEQNVWPSRYRKRSTKAGPSGPATPAGASAPRQQVAFAQRRPALPGRQPQPGVTQACRPRVVALNEGRPFRAGNPRRGGAAQGRTNPRSTKAGPSGPATPAIAAGKPRRPRRSTKAGPSGPATRSPDEGRPLRNSRSSRPGRRSTKAGPSGPATPVNRRRVPPVRAALNEGRPFRAGNPGHAARIGPRSPTSTHAQRRPALPGRQPRGPVLNDPMASRALNEGRPFRAGNPPRSSGGPVGRRGVLSAQRRPALPGRQPREPWRPRRSDADPARSTKAGPSGPATPVRAFAALTTTVPGVRAQRRPALPGRQPFADAAPPCRMDRALNEGRPFRAGNPAPHQLLGH